MIDTEIFRQLVETQEDSSIRSRRGHFDDFHKKRPDQYGSAFPRFNRFKMDDEPATDRREHDLA